MPKNEISLNRMLKNLIILENSQSSPKKYQIYTKKYIYYT